MPARLDSSGQVVMSFAGQQPHPTSLFFLLSGDQPKQVNSISINAAEAKSEAKQQMLACIRALYQTIGWTVPRALPAYIENEQHYLSHQPYGIVSSFSTTKRNPQTKRDEQVLWFRMGNNP